MLWTYESFIIHALIIIFIIQPSPSNKNQHKQTCNKATLRSFSVTKIVVQIPRYSAAKTNSALNSEDNAAEKTQIQRFGAKFRVSWKTVGPINNNDFLTFITYEKTLLRRSSDNSLPAFERHTDRNFSFSYLKILKLDLLVACCFEELHKTKLCLSLTQIQSLVFIPLFLPCTCDLNSHYVLGSQDGRRTPTLVQFGFSKMTSCLLLPYNLLVSMPNRLEAVIKSKGNIIKY